MNEGHKMWFNTGVFPWNRSRELSEHEAWIGGRLHIAYYLESAPPERSELLWLAQEADPAPYYVSIPIIGGGMSSKFAIFKVYRPLAL
jgi:hypothetical protein